MNKFLIVAIWTLAIIGCSNDDNPKEVSIRLENTSQSEYKNIVINTSTGFVDFPDLNPGERSKYQVFDRAYRYAYVKVEIDGIEQVLQPIDYVGETPLENGNYTYEIARDPRNIAGATLILTLVRD